VGHLPNICRNVLPPSSGSKNYRREQQINSKQEAQSSLLDDCSMLSLLVHSEDEFKSLRNFCIVIRSYRITSLKTVIFTVTAARTSTFAVYIQTMIMEAGYSFETSK
jgi:hypothetical protein